MLYECALLTVNIVTCIDIFVRHYITCDCSCFICLRSVKQLLIVHIKLMFLFVPSPHFSKKMHELQWHVAHCPARPYMHYPFILRYLRFVVVLATPSRLLSADNIICTVFYNAVFSAGTPHFQSNL